MQPLVSVALSTCNGERFLAEQLESVLAQRGVALEVVVVDDGSIDSTPALLDAFACRDRRLSWTANPGNLGPSRSFQRAFSLCSGQFIAACDQDDVWDTTKLRRLLDAIGAADLAYCDSLYTDADGHADGTRISDRMPMLAGNAPLQFAFANSVSGHACLFRADLLEAALPVPEAAYHDWWLAMLAAGRGGIVYHPEPLVRFRRDAAAFSPTGHQRHRQGARGHRDPAWLDVRRAVLAGYAATGLRDHERAAALHDALEQAIATGAMRPLARSLWQAPACVPRWRGVRAIDTAKLFKRLRRHIVARRSNPNPGGERTD